MLEVREATARALFEAQKKRMQGRLRLDVSSISFPRDVQEPLDVQAARLAIGRRVVQTIEQCAAEAVSTDANCAGFDAGAVPPARRSGELLTLMPNQERFEPFLEKRLERLFGLDRQHPRYCESLALLAHDIFGWCQVADANAENFVVVNGSVAMRCQAEPISLSPLAQRAITWPASADD